VARRPDCRQWVSFPLIAGVVVAKLQGIRAAAVSVAIFGAASALLILTRIGTGWVLLTGAAIGMWPLLR